MITVLVRLSRREGDEKKVALVKELCTSKMGEANWEASGRGGPFGTLTCTFPSPLTAAIFLLALMKQDYTIEAYPTK